ncbi:MAG: DUF3465 domain-containing protein [Bacteroidota bacterium]
MKKIVLPAFILIAAGLFAYFGGNNENPSVASSPANKTSRATQSNDDALDRAFKSHASGLPVAGEGRVKKILNDDIEGSRHQRFIVRLSSGQTILIAHNIDLAPRVPSLKEGDLVSFSGEYEWNRNGGTVHWTHRDPRGSHRAGWLRHEGRTFQ